ncbi:MAG: hypothetical protein M3R70_11020 [Actinomycetota bacterium]|nr:hypothetical protein [Actinomycetota bacterium]
MRLNLAASGTSLLARTLALLTIFAAIGAVFASTAAASQQVDRNAVGATIRVNRQGFAMISYRKRQGVVRGVRNVLAWGAINARHPTRRVKQVKLKLDYAAGWGRFRRDMSKGFKNRCRRYDGPKLPWLVSSCKAPDGSYWALQSWQVNLPDLGFVPWLPQQKYWDLRVSHWTGSLAKVEVWTNWIYSGRFHELFGRLTYKGKPVYGFGTTNYGAPTDGYGRLLYLDTYNSKYGSGWRRENSFVAHNPTGVWCYGFYPRDPHVGGYPIPPGTPHRNRPLGIGERYRINVPGPGVTPDILWEGAGLHDFNGDNPNDVDYERRMNDQLDAILNGDKLCRQH